MLKGEGKKNRKTPPVREKVCLCLFVRGAIILPKKSKNACLQSGNTARVPVNVFYPLAPEHEALKFAYNQLGALQNSVLQPVFKGACITWNGMIRRGEYMHHKVLVQIPNVVDAAVRDTIAEHVAQIFSTPAQPELQKQHVALLQEKQLNLAEVLLHLHDDLHDLHWENTLPSSEFAALALRVIRNEMEIAKGDPSNSIFDLNDLQSWGSTCKGYLVSYCVYLSLCVCVCLHSNVEEKCRSKT